MTGNRAQKLAWGMIGLVIAGIIIELILWGSFLTEMPTLPDILGEISTGILVPLVFCILGKLILNQQPGNKVGWFMMLIGLTAVTPYSTYLENLPAPPTTLTPALFLLLWFENWSWVPTIISIFLIPLYFPTGRLPSPRWKWVPGLAIFLWLFLMIVLLFGNEIGPIDGNWQSLSNPIGFIPTDSLDGPILMLFGVGLLSVIGGSVGSLFVRYRRAHRVERQQLKWLLYAGALFAISFGLTFFLTDPESNAGWNSFWFILSVLAIPVAIAIAILRYQLYDIDLIIRKTLVYAVLTAALGLVYFGTVVLLQTVIGRASGEQSPLVIVISTLLIAALFSPLRRRIQAFIDRRFFRRKYDAAQILAQFANSARDEVDVDRLSAVLLRAIEETMQPEQTSLWLKETKGVKRS